MDQLLDEAVLQDPVLQTKAQAADGVIGVGRTSAIALVVSMPELGTLTSKQAGALAGLPQCGKVKAVASPIAIFRFACDTLNP
jgi:hypothetical protein